MERHETLAFETPVCATRERWWADAERGALAGALAITLGSLPSMVLYLRVYWEQASTETWHQLAAQSATFVVATGALWGAAVGAAVGLTRTRGALRRGSAAAIAGAVGAAPAGTIAALHFGQMNTPYFGGVSILLAAVATLVIAGIGFARLTQRTPLARALGCTLGAAALCLVLLLPLCVALPSAALFLELDEMRFIASAIGLGPMGACVGSILGAIGGVWVGATISLARGAVGR
jgi:hypothetical protein